MEANVRLQAKAPEDAEFYVVVQGSTLSHVTSAKTGDDGMTLCFTAPGMSTSNSTQMSFFASDCLAALHHEFLLSSTGHARAESAAVTSYIYTEDQVKPCEGEARLEYLRDVAQEAAEYLSANRDHLGPQSYLEVLKRFSTRTADEELSAEGSDCSEEDAQLRRCSGDETGLRQLDEKIALAMANMDYPQQWENTESQPREGNEIGSESATNKPRSCRFFFGRGRFVCTPVH